MQGQFYRLKTKKEKAKTLQLVILVGISKVHDILSADHSVQYTSRLVENPIFHRVSSISAGNRHISEASSVSNGRKQLTSLLVACGKGGKDVSEKLTST